MILTCPACTMRYMVSEGAVGPDGRRVRCASCGHQWFQGPEEGLDETLFAHDDDIGFAEDADTGHDAFLDDVEAVVASVSASDDFQSILQKEIEATPIPAGVMPEAHDPVMEQLQKDRQKKSKLPSGEKTSGFVLAGAIWVCLFAVFLFCHESISRAWPPSNLVYNLVGMKPVMPGEGLALDALHAAIREDVILLSGEINNLKDTAVKVPSIMVSIVDKDNVVIDQVLIAPPVASLKAEGQASFEATYPKVPEGAVNVNFGFSFIKAKAPEKTEEKKAEETSGEHVEEKPKAPEPPQAPVPHH